MPQRTMLGAGSRAPEFDLPLLAGGRASLDSLLKRGPVLLAFFKVSCPVCQYTFPFLGRMADQTRLQIVGVSQDDAQATRAFNDRFGVNFPVVLDERPAAYPASNAFGISHVPSLFLIEPDGTVSWSESGFSKAGLVDVGRRAGVQPFREHETVPQFKAG